MFKNVASQKIQLFAFDATTSVPKTGDAANITAYVSKDHGAVTVLGDTSATEMDATNSPGVYLFDLTQGETNADELTFSAKSSTANIKIVPRFISTNPPNFTAASVDSNGRVDVIKIAGTTQTARDIGASVLLSSGTGTGQLDFTSGVVKANATQWLGGTIPAVNVTGVPLVDLKYTLGTISPATAGSVRCDSVTGAVGSVTGNVGGNVVGSVASVSGAVGSVTGNVGGNVVGSVASVSGAVGSVTGNVGGNVTGSVGSVTGLTASNLDATISSRLASASYTTPPTAAQNATAVLTTQMTESYATDGTAPTLTQAVMLTQQVLTESSVASTTLTAKKLDGSTNAATFTLNSSTAPTSITRTT